MMRLSRTVQQASALGVIMVDRTLHVSDEGWYFSMWGTQHKAPVLSTVAPPARYTWSPSGDKSPNILGTLSGFRDFHFVASAEKHSTRLEILPWPIQRESDSETNVINGHDH